MTDSVVAQLLRLKKEEQQAEAKASQLAKQELALDKLERQKKDELDGLKALLVVIQTWLEPFESDQSNHPLFHSWTPTAWGANEILDDPAKEPEEPTFEEIKKIASAPIVIDPETMEWLAGGVTVQ